MEESNSNIAELLVFSDFFSQFILNWVIKELDADESKVTELLEWLILLGIGSEKRKLCPVVLSL